jgi:trehalose 6-phosphate phosphatase
LKHKYKAVISDLDGVITYTAKQHALSWKMMFEYYNNKRRSEGKETFEPFSIENDYPQHIDGIPRYDGVRAFLNSRNIEIPYGSPTDSPGMETICGLGNLKNEYYLEIIESKGVEVIQENVNQIRKWKASGMKTAIISSSKNCKMILETVGLLDLFEVKIDGIDALERNIKGKPEPDLFLKAAEDLNVLPREAIVIEDALSGIRAGRRGNFGLIIAIAGKEDHPKYLKAGADIAVESLDDPEIKKIIEDE